MTKNEWLKAHVIIGVQTNVIATVEISESPTTILFTFRLCQGRRAEVKRAAPLGGQGVFYGFNHHIARQCGFKPSPVKSMPVRTAIRSGTACFITSCFNREESLRSPSPPLERRDDLQYGTSEFAARIRSKPRG